MNNESMRVVLNRITSRIESGSRRIDGETYAQFFEMLSEVIAGDADAPSDLEDLERLAYAAKAYDRADELPGFDVGALWGSFGTLDAVRRLRGAEEEERRLALMIERHRDLFSTVSANPDITQGELADALGTSRSNLSQILARIEPYRLLHANPVGRSKHYRLTRRARQLFDEIDGRREDKEVRNRSTEAYVQEFDEAGVAQRRPSNYGPVRGSSLFKGVIYGQRDHEVRSQTHYGRRARSQLVPAGTFDNSNRLGRAS